ncbi:MAG: HAD hydrolase family protein [Victivallaceae bacterium]
MSEKTKIFITDLDGTALGGGYKPYARFPDFFSEFLDSLAKQGCRWGINTTWDIGGQWDMVNLSNVKSRPEFMMGEFGLRLACGRNGAPEFVQPYTGEMEARLQAACATKMMPLIREICGKFNSSRLFYYGHLFQFHLASAENLDEFKAFSGKFFSDKELTCSFKERALSVRPAFLNKGVPLKEIVQREKIGPDQIVVAGDEPADLDMMNPELASFFICPSNAAAEVKEHVLKHGGAVGDLPYGAGVVQAYDELSKRHNWGARR